MFKKTRISLFRNYFLTTTIFLALSVYGEAQSLADSLDASMHRLSRDLSLDIYYEKLKDAETYYYENNFPEKIIQNASLYNRLPSSADDSLVYRKATMYYANLLQKVTGDIHQSLRYYKIAHRHGAHINFNDKWSWYIENKLANNYARLGDYTRAIYFYKICAESSSGKSRLGRLYKNISSTYYFLKDYDNAIDYLNQALQIAEREKDLRALTSSYEQLAIIHLDKENYVRFKEYYDKAMTVLLNLDVTEQPKRKMKLYDLYGDYCLKIAENSEAIDFYYKAIEIAEKNLKSKRRREIAKLYCKVADVFLVEENFLQCDSAIKKAYSRLVPDNSFKTIPAISEIYLDNTFVEILNLQAKKYYLRSKTTHLMDLDSAVMACDTAIAIIDLITFSISTDESKLISIADYRKTINRAVKYAYEIYALDADSKAEYLDKISLYFQKSKGKLINNLQQREKLKLKLPKVVQDSINRLEESLVMLEKNGIEGNHREKQRYLLLDSLQNIFTGQQGMDRRRDKINSPFIEYLVSENAIYLLSNLEETSALKLSTNPSRVKETVDKVRIGIENKNSNIDSLLVKLTEDLVPYDLSDLDEITFILDDFLCQFPFDLLRYDNKYLIEQLPIKYAYQNYQEKLLNKDQSSISMISLFPDYPMLNQNNMDSELPYLSPLNYSVEEKICISSLSEFEISERNVADPIELKRDLVQNNIFHFGGHAIVDGDNPYIIVVDSLGNTENIYSEQLIHMGSDLDLVCLSACRTGTGILYSGDGVRSLASSFLQTGARSIVYSLWNINDKSTSTIMCKMYKYLGMGLAKNRALRNAKLEFLENASPSERHPYFWAGIALMGDSSALVHNKSNRRFCLIMLGAIALIVFATRISKRNRQ